MTARDRLDEIQQRADAATEAESWWTVVPPQAFTDEDFAFIDGARQDIPALVDALRAVLADQGDQPPFEGARAEGWRAAFQHAERLITDALGSEQV